MQSKDKTAEQKGKGHVKKKCKEAKTNTPGKNNIDQNSISSAP